jgi:uncharacterized membrane protein YfcA
MAMTIQTAALLLLVGLAIGVVGGMLGIGGGILVIPALVVLFKQPHETAVGTSLAMLLPPIGIFAFLEYHRHGNVNVPMAILLAVGFALGAYLGGRGVNTGLIPRDTLRMLFAYFLIYVAGTILIQSEKHVWAVVKTTATLILVAVTYAALRLVGKRLARRFDARETFARALQHPLRPDYEI